MNDAVPTMVAPRRLWEASDPGLNAEMRDIVWRTPIVASSAFARAQR